MSKTIKILTFLLIGINCIAQNNIFFEKEDITFEIKDNVFIVQGIYYFNSTSNKEFSILYPFPTDSIYSKPFGIRVKYINSGQQLNYKTANDSSSVVFRVLADSIQPIQISYQQKLNSNRARYILRTTSYWQKPLKQVDYRLVTDLNFSITNFSFQPDKEIEIDNKKVYLWHKENFIPTNDFIIDF